MESYVEITWFTSFLMLLHSSTLAFYVAWKPQPFYKLVIYSMVLPFFACICFSKHAWIWLLLLEGGFFWWIYRYAWKTWLILLANRFLWNFTAYALFGGTFHLGIFFVPSKVIPWGYWFILLTTWVFLYHKWKSTLAQRDFIYPIQIVCEKTRLKIKGYLDSGNLLTCGGVPVIFLDQKYQEYFEHNRIELVVMNGVDATKVIRCKEAKMKVGDGGFHMVLINTEKSLHLPLGAHALLNMHLMTQE